MGEKKKIVVQNVIEITLLITQVISSYHISYNDSETILLNIVCLMIQVTHAAQNHARTGAFVPPSEKRLMNVTAHGLGILGQIAQLVSMNGTQEKPTLLSWFFCLSHIHFLISVFPAEFLTWVKVSLKPSPNTVHYLLTRFKGFWNIINNISFLRDAIMRYVLTCTFPTSLLILWQVAKTH